MINFHNYHPKILVIGDLMIDHYLWGSCERISPEAPVQIVNIENEHYKEMIQHYKDNFVRTTDMFLVRNSLLHHYVNKLNKYEEISYISEHDILLNTQKEEVVEKKNG